MNSNSVKKTQAMTASDLEVLAKPFLPEEICWRVQKKGIKNNRPWVIVVPYVDSRAIQRRLDQVVGPANWQNELMPIDGGVICSIKIRVDGEWISKSDGAEGESGIEGMDKIKTAVSRSLVRAAVIWGMGRELYDYPTCFGEIVDSNTENAYRVTIEGRDYNWLPPNFAAKEKPVEMAPPRTRAHEVPNVIAPKYSQGPVVLPKPKDENLGDLLVPFGLKKNSPLKEHTEDDLRGLDQFYKNNQNLKGGAAKSFRPKFYSYLESLGWKQQ